MLVTPNEHKKGIRAARNVFVWVSGRDNGYWIRITKEEAYFLVDKAGDFEMDVDGTNVYISYRK